MSDGTVCQPCNGTLIDCDTGSISVVPCDDGDPNTIDDVQTILDCDGSICIPCAGTFQESVTVPNIFTPNGDGLNDIFYVRSNGFGKVQILNLSIFNRWGNLVYAAFNFPPNDDQYGWRGDQNGVTLNPGVYIYLIEVGYGDGRTEILSGDLTLVK